MLPILEYDLYKYLALAVMLLAILFAYRKGRGAVSASSRSLAWTHIPLIAFSIASLGPSAFAIVIYLGYKLGLIQPKPPGYSFSTFIRDLPFDFAVINWPFVALILDLPPVAEFRLGPVRDVAFRGGDVPAKCFIVFPGLDDGFRRLRCWARHWRDRGHAQFADHRDDLARPSSWYF